jgi:hypothetical protein
MEYTIYKLENTKARLCAGRTVTNDPMIAEMVRKAWEAAGFIVTMETES